MEMVKQNLSFLGVSLIVVALTVGIAYRFERAARARRVRAGMPPEKILTTRKIVMIGMFAAISGVLYCFDFAVPFSPPFYKLDFSELPALIAGFAFGPVAGVMVEFVKVVIKLLIKSTSTAFVGDLANFLIGCMLVLPASVIYCMKKTRARALIGCAAGTALMTVFGTWFNAVYLLPTFSVLFHMELDKIIAMGAAINGRVVDLTSFVILMVAPVNLVKGVGISLITMLIYKRLSPMLHGRV